MPTLFGTDGIRGEANRSPMTPEEVLLLGRAVGRWFLASFGQGALVLGRDTRQSGSMLESALAAGLTSAGMNVILAGVLPTPAIAWRVASSDALGGAVISASHNPFADNGVKLFLQDGSKLTPNQEDQIEALLEQPDPATRIPTGASVGTVSEDRGTRERYIEHAGTFVPGDRPFRDLKLVCDCANGAASRTTPQVLWQLGATVQAINVRPSGVNINAGCGSTYLDAVQRALRDRSGWLGLSHDGDADRVLLCDEEGLLVDGDQMLGLLARDLKERGQLRGNRVVATILSNLGLDEAMATLGVEVIRTAVGDRSVRRGMDESGAVAGGEPSGHLILNRHGPTGDGLLTALAVLDTVVRSGQTLRELASLVRLYPQYAGTVPVNSKPDLATLSEVQSAIEAARESLGDRGRVVVRYSGTERLARVMIEGPEADEIRQLAQTIESAIGRALS